LFVRVLVGILSWETLSDPGMDVYQSNRHFFHCMSTWTYSQCDRRCVPGKAARVYKIKTALGPTKSETESGQFLSPLTTLLPHWNNQRLGTTSELNSCPGGGIHVLTARHLHYHGLLELQITILHFLFKWATGYSFGRSCGPPSRKQQFG
jgi:hypothetical protein